MLGVGPDRDVRGLRVLSAQGAASLRRWGFQKIKNRDPHKDLFKHTLGNNAPGPVLLRLSGVSMSVGWPSWGMAFLFIAAPSCSQAALCCCSGRQNESMCCATQLCSSAAF